MDGTEDERRTARDSGADTERTDPDLDWRDYVAISAALAQTILLPVFLVIVSLALLLVLVILFG